MADYNQATISGEQWTRCYQINIGNRRGETPVVTFDEETVLQLDSGQVVTGQAVLRVPFDPTATIQLVNPETLEPITELIDGVETPKTVSHGEMYALLFSAYIGAARARDAANASLVYPPVIVEPING